MSDEPTARRRGLPVVEGGTDELAQLLGRRTPAVFLDFDGTLAPIVDDPDTARLPPATRDAVARLAARCPVAVVSGRDTDDVRRRVGVDALVYAGSHGFDVHWPDGRRFQRGLQHLDRLRTAEGHLARELAGIPGVELEAKRFALAVHHRRVPPDRVDEVEAALARVADRVPGLRRTGGKQVLELRPDLEWDKGRAVLSVLDELGLDAASTLPLYIGDDLTDEDAFDAVAGRGGVGLVVLGEDDDRPTRAAYAVADVTATARLLRGLADLLDAR